MNLKNIIPPNFRCIFLIAGDNFHLESQRQVSAEKAIAKLEQFTIPYIEFSSQTKQNIQKLLDYLVDCFLTSLNDETS